MASKIYHVPFMIVLASVPATLYSQNGATQHGSNPILQDVMKNPTFSAWVKKAIENADGEELLNSLEVALKGDQSKWEDLSKKLGGSIQQETYAKLDKELSKLIEGFKVHNKSADIDYKDKVHDFLNTYLKILEALEKRDVQAYVRLFNSNGVSLDRALVTRLPKYVPYPQ